MQNGDDVRMDEAQRRTIGDQVKQARETRGWPRGRLSEAAGVAVNTVRAIEAGTPVRDGSLGKVLEALEIEPLSEVVARRGEPTDVHVLLDVVRMWLLGMPEDQRPAASGDLVRWIMERNQTGR